MTPSRDVAKVAVARDDPGTTIDTYDWAATPLGPIRNWPQSLRTVVGILATSRFAMWMGWGPDLAFFYNDAYAPTLGEKRGWALGRPSREVWAEIWSDIGPRVEQVLATGRATWDEALMLFLERNGYPEETYHTFSYSPLRDDSDAIAGMLCVVTEETERIISERRLRTLGDLAAQLAEPGTEAGVLAAIQRSLGGNPKDLPFCLVYLFDDESGTARLAVSSGFQGSDAAILERIERGDLARLWPGDAIWAGEASAVVDGLDQVPGLPPGAWTRPATQALAVAIARQGQDRPAGFLIAGINPHRRLDESTVDFLRLIAGQAASALASARAYDAERRRAEALAELDRAKTAFFSNVSHEFRTPLTLMLGPLRDALEHAEESSGRDLRPMLELASRNAQRLLRLVNTLLDFSRIEAGRARGTFRPVDLARLTADLAASFQSVMQRASLDFVIACEPLPCPVYVDTDMWEKIVLNLLSNAFKFTFAGEVRVSLLQEEQAAVLTVSDTGTGIASNQLPRIFERFHRIEGSRGRSHEGSGIGLALVRDLVSLHGGAITVRSQPERGTIFRVSVPLGHAHLPPEQVAGPLAVADGSITGTAFADEALTWLADAQERPTIEGDVSPDVTEAGDVTMAGAMATGRILLADDNADMRAYLRRLLDAAGHEVVSVADGQAALEQIRGHRPDLVLTDVMMPHLDGLGLLRAIRADAALRDIPVILVSARAGEDSRIEGLQTQADDYLTKPFAAGELLARVGANLGIARLRRAALEEQRELAERLRESEATLRHLNETLEARVAERTAERDQLWEFSEDLLVVADVGGRLLRVSPSWTRLLGWTESHLLSVRYDQLIHPDDGEATSRGLRDMVRTRRPTRLDSRVRTSGGDWCWISWVLSPDAGGASVFGVGRDVSSERAARDALMAQIEERERVEATLRQMQRLEAVGQLTSGVAHDFNNLLTVILGNIEFIGRAVQDSGLHRRLDMMRSAARRGANLTGQLLAFSRKQHLDPKALDLNEVVRGMDDLLRSTLGGTVRLQIELGEELHAALVDQTQLELVVLNLAINARDAMPVGGTLTIATANVTLAASSTPEAPAAGDYVMVAVTDSGSGMSPEVRGRVFEPFFTTKAPGKGSGLGLAQVYGFAKQSGGGVGIETEVGVGTTVRVYLPRASGAPSAVGDESNEPAPPAAQPRLRALVVDDDVAVRETTRTMLEECGFQVTEAGGGEAVLDMLAGSAAFDVLLVDFAMPGMNGAELARQVRARLPALPIVLVTGYAESRDLHEASEWPIVLKPFLPDQLAATLRDVVSRTAGRPSAVH